ncbi:MAG: extracellular solute-binding protein, partial [Candidatus Zixiibacteriota bacterium]
SGDWLLKRIAKEKRKVDLAAYLFPGPHNIGKSFMGGEFLAINAASKHKKEAQAFIRFITSPENQLRFCKASFASNPSSKKTQADPYFTSDPIRDIFVRQLRASEHPPVDPDWVYIEDEIEKAVENVIFHGGLPGMSLRDAQIAITKIHRHDTEAK